MKLLSNVIRGLPNSSFAELSDKLKSFQDLGMNIPVLIDPDSFEKYEVSAVPTIVLKQKEAASSIAKELFYRLRHRSSKGANSEDRILERGRSL